MITAAECISMLLDRFPGFVPAWKQYLADWEGAPAGACTYMTAFSHYVYDLIAGGPREELQAIFAVAETLMVDGDEETQTAAATCFLENLQNREAPPEHWVHLLGPASQEHCRAWDEFTGVRTPGLW